MIETELSNPLALRLRDLEQEIEQLERRRAALAAQLDWAAAFNPNEATEEIDSLRSQLAEHQTEFYGLDAREEELSVELGEFADQLPRLEREAHRGLNPLHWFSRERAAAESRLNANRLQTARIRQRRREAVEQRAQIAGEVITLTNRVFEKEGQLAEFRSFRRATAQDDVQRIDGDLKFLGSERARILARKAEVDSRLEAPLQQLCAYDSEINENELEVAKLEKDLAHLEHRIAEAERIDRELSHESSKYERWRLHEESQRLLGDGKPRLVLQDLRVQTGPVRSALRGRKSEIARLRRDRDKTADRVQRIFTIASSDIRALIIDGNNCCYEGDQFIRLAALIPLAGRLASRYDVTVIFDADIRGLLHANDTALRSVMPSVNIHVVATGTKADETILAAAEDPCTWVISNDRFGDFGDRAAVRERRVIRHEILNGHVMVHDLNLNVEFSGGARR